MAVRTTMSDLIARARLLIADPVSASSVFADQQIQDKLDEVRTDVWQALLMPRITFSNPSSMQYLDYYYIPGGNPRGRPLGFWEQGEVLLNGSFAVLTPATSDEIVGHWTFSPSQPPPVMIRGRHYDIYRACADLLDYKIASMASTTFDFSADGRSFRRSQILDRLEKMRDDYRRKQRAVTNAMRRQDNGDGSEAGMGIPPRQAGLVGSASQDVPFLTGE